MKASLEVVASAKLAILGIGHLACHSLLPFLVDFSKTSSKDHSIMTEAVNFTVLLYFAFDSRESVVDSTR